MKQRIRVIVVEPKYQQNIGYIARIMKNFGLSDLAFVNPRCRVKGKSAIKYSKHASELLRNSKEYKSLGKAISGIAVGTTGIWEKSDSSFYNIYNLSELRGIRSWNRSREVSIVIGRDDTGLSKSEIALCDAMVFIGANKDYPVLNISHALAILLYEFTLAGFAEEYAFIGSLRSREEDRERLIKVFDMLVEKRANIRDKKAVTGAFRRVLKRAMPTDKEINAIAAAISPKN